jgi:hypothetical protein
MLRTSFLSAAALSLAIAAPAYAQTAPTGPLDIEQVRERLGDADIEERRDFGGRLFRGMTEEGQTVFMMVSPRNLSADTEIELTEEDLRDRFAEAGFTMIQEVHDAEFIVGDLDDEISVIVLRPHDFQDPVATGAVPPPTPGAEPGAVGAPAPGMPGATPPPGGTADSPLPGSPAQPGAPAPRQ